MVAARPFIFWIDPLAVETPVDEPDVDDEVEPNLFYYDGADWIAVNVLVYDGADWVEMEPEVNYYTGSAWDT
jgi:hypothetical protein